MTRSTITKINSRVIAKAMLCVQQARLWDATLNPYYCLRVEQIVLSYIAVSRNPIALDLLFGTFICEYTNRLLTHDQNFDSDHSSWWQR